MARKKEEIKYGGKQVFQNKVPFVSNDLLRGFYAIDNREDD